MTFKIRQFLSVNLQEVLDWFIKLSLTFSIIMFQKKKYSTNTYLRYFPAFILFNNCRFFAGVVKFGLSQRVAPEKLASNILMGFKTNLGPISAKDPSSSGKTW